MVNPALDREELQERGAEERDRKEPTWGRRGCEFVATLKPLAYRRRRRGPLT